VAAAALALAVGERRRALASAHHAVSGRRLVLFLGTLVPAIGIIQVGRQALADRYTYIPSIGFWLAVVWGLGQLTEKIARNRRTSPGRLAQRLGLPASSLTVRQTSYWKDTGGVVRHARNITQHNWIATARSPPPCNKKAKPTKPWPCISKPCNLPDRTESLQTGRPVVCDQRALPRPRHSSKGSRTRPH